MAIKTDLTEQVIPDNVDQSNRCLLIDADSICFLIGWGLEKKNITEDDYMRVVHEADNFMHELMRNSGAVSYIGFFGGVHPTFRHLLDINYKANRGQVKPEWYRAWASVIKHRLCYKWKFHTIEGIEAEDAVGIMAKHLGYTKVIIGHLDKDLEQIPGIHYNYQKQRKYFVPAMAAIRNLYCQILTGDTVDNLPGCPGIGPVKAEKLLAAGDIHSNPDLAEETYKAAIVQAFEKAYGLEKGAYEAMKAFTLTKVLENVNTNGFVLSVENYSPVEYVGTQSSHNLFSDTGDKIVGLSDKNLTQVQNLFE